MSDVTLKFVCHGIIMKIKIIGLLWFYGISTIVCYLMPNPVFTYILNI